MKKLIFIFLFLISQVHAAQTVFTDSTVASCVDPAPTNTGNGSCTTSNPTGFLQTETFTFTATSGGPTATFTVSGSVSGSHTSITSGGTRAVKTSAGFTKFSINIADGGTAWVAGDNFTVATTSGTIFRKSNFDLLTVNQICSNGCDLSTILNLLTNTAVRFQDASGGQYVGFVAPSVVNASYSITLPADAPASNTFLKYNGTDYVWGTETTSFPLSATDGSVSAPSYSWASSAGSGEYYISTNTIGMATGGIRASKVDGSQQWTWGAASTSQRSHNIVKDVNAGDSSQPLYLNIGNSGSQQGTGSIYWGNSSVTGSPAFGMYFIPRLNNDSGDYTAGRYEFYKDASANTSKFDLYTYDGSTLRRTLSMAPSSTSIFGIVNSVYGTFMSLAANGTNELVTLNNSGAFNTAGAASELTQGLTGGVLYLSSSPNAGGAAIQLYEGSHATRPSEIAFRNAGSETARFYTRDVKFTPSSGTEYSILTGSTIYDLNLCADSTGSNGGQVVLFGSSHATQANTIQINTNNVSALQVDANQRVDGKPGASTSQTTAIGGILNSNSTAVGNVGGGTDDLMTYTLPANVLNITNDSIHIVAGGTFAANANSKRLICLFGSSNIIDSTALVLNGGSWHLDAWVIRTGASSEKAIATLQSSNSLLVSTTTYSSLSESLTTTRTIKCTAAATSDNDITEELSVVEFKPAK